MSGLPERYHLFLQWLMFAGVVVFCLWLAWHYGVVGGISARDPTYVSWLIGLMFLGASVHCGIRAHYLSRQMNILRAIVDSTHRGGKIPLRIVGEQLMVEVRALDTSLAGDYLHSILLRYGTRPTTHELQIEHTQLTEILAEQARGQHEMGWFITGLLLKLGLLGTVIGFVMMLGSVSGMASLDFSDIQQVLSNMTVGMGVALNTTLVGLTGSMLLGFQYLLLDRGADAFICRTVQAAQTMLIPQLGECNGNR